MKEFKIGDIVVFKSNEYRNDYFKGLMRIIGIDDEEFGWPTLDIAKYKTGERLGIATPNQLTRPSFQDIKKHRCSK